MINRIQKIMEKSLHAKHKDQIDLDITAPHYENAMAVEELKENTINFATRALIDELVSIKQNYPRDFKTTVDAEIDIVIFEGKEYRELQKLINGLHEIWLEKKQKKTKQERTEV